MQMAWQADNHLQQRTNSQRVRGEEWGLIYDLSANISTGIQVKFVIWQDIGNGEWLLCAIR